MSIDGASREKFIFRHLDDDRLVFAKRKNEGKPDEYIKIYQRKSDPGVLDFIKYFIQDNILKNVKAGAEVMQHMTGKAAELCSAVSSTKCNTV